MWPVALDLMLLAVLARELFALEDLVPLVTSASVMVALSFLIGMAAAQRSAPDAIHYRTFSSVSRSIISVGLNIILLTIFVTALSARGLGVEFSMFYGLLLLMYALGCAIGMTLRALLLIAVIFGTMIVAGRMLT